MLNTFVSKDSKLPLVCAIAHGGLTRDHKGTMAKMAQRGEAEEEGSNYQCPNPGDK